MKSAAYLGRLDDPTPMTRTVMSEIFKDMVRTVCHRTFRLGAMRGTGVVTVRFSERPEERALKAVLETLMRDKAVACGEIWHAADPLEFPISTEERLRGGDRKIEACLIVETLRVPDAEGIAAALATDFQRTDDRRLSVALRDYSSMSKRRGEETGDLPVQAPTKHHLAKAVKALGITVPPSCSLAPTR